jgi:hypothetical protein
MSKSQTHGFITEPTESNNGYAGLSEAMRRESPAPRGAFAPRDPTTALPFSGGRTRQPQAVSAPSEGEWNTAAKAKLRNSSMNSGTFAQSAPSTGYRPSSSEPSGGGTSPGWSPQRPSLGGFASQLSMGGSGSGGGAPPPADSAAGGGASGGEASPRRVRRAQATPARSTPTGAIPVPAQTRTVTSGGFSGVEDVSAGVSRSVANNSANTSGPGPTSQGSGRPSFAGTNQNNGAVEGGSPAPRRQGNMLSRAITTNNDAVEGGSPAPRRQGNMLSRAITTMAEHPYITGGAVAGVGLLARSPRMVQTGLGIAGGALASDTAGTAVRAAGGDDTDELAARVVAGGLGGYGAAMGGRRGLAGLANAARGTATPVRAAMNSVPRTAARSVATSSLGNDTPGGFTARVAAGNAERYRPRSSPRMDVTGAIPSPLPARSAAAASPPVTRPRPPARAPQAPSSVPPTPVQAPPPSSPAPVPAQTGNGGRNRTRNTAPITAAPQASTPAASPAPSTSVQAPATPPPAENPVMAAASTPKAKKTRSTAPQAAMSAEPPQQMASPRVERSPQTPTPQGGRGFLAMMSRAEPPGSRQRQVAQSPQGASPEAPPTPRPSTERGWWSPPEPQRFVGSPKK